VFVIELNCVECTDIRTYEQPPCHEQHEPACPEWACTRCGTAMLVDPPLLVDRPLLVDPLLRRDARGHGRDHGRGRDRGRRGRGKRDARPVAA
jgi:hypothetical protein